MEEEQGRTKITESFNMGTLLGLAYTPLAWFDFLMIKLLGNLVNKSLTKVYTRKLKTWRPSNSKMVGGPVDVQKNSAFSQETELESDDVFVRIKRFLCAINRKERERDRGIR